MKKLPAAIPASAMFLILAVLLVFMCLPIGQNTGNAVNGVLDLRKTQQNGLLYTLNGEWSYTNGKLLTPGDNYTFFETIKTPSSWEDAGYSLNGCATYRLNILVGEKKPLMLYIPEISTAYALWVNGTFIREAGTVSANAETGKPMFENALIPIQAENSVIELLIQVSNHNFMYSGLMSPLILGTTDKVLSWFFRTRALYCAAMGCIMIAAFYHLALFIFRRREKVYLIFSMLCLLCLVRFFMETNGLNQYFQLIPLNMFGIRLYMYFFFLHSASIVIFSLYVFNRDFLKRYKYPAALYIALCLFLVAVIPLNTSFSVAFLTVSIMPFFLLVIIKAARSGVLREDRWTRLYFTALLLYLAAGYITKYFFDNIIFMTGLLTNMFLIMAQSLVLARNYTAAFELVEHTNSNLERIVDNRTKDLLNTNNAMKELVGNISHDLKTPLSAMSVSLERLLSLTPDDKNYKRYTQIAYAKSIDLKRLTQNLIDVSRIEAGQNQYRPEWISLNNLLSQIQEKYADYIESEGLYLDVTGSGEDISVFTDPIKIWNVFDNIIYNSLRHTVEGGITVTAETKNGVAVIIITDTGCGIPKEHLPRIFDRFYKVSGGRGPHEGDSGIGLYIVKSVMEGCGGSVYAKSEVGTGTSVILTFTDGKPAYN